MRLSWSASRPMPEGQSNVGRRAKSKTGSVAIRTRACAGAQKGRVKSASRSLLTRSAAARRRQPPQPWRKSEPLFLAPAEQGKTGEEGEGRERRRKRRRRRIDTTATRGKMDCRKRSSFPPT